MKKLIIRIFNNLSILGDLSRCVTYNLREKIPQIYLKYWFLISQSFRKYTNYVFFFTELIMNQLELIPNDGTVPDTQDTIRYNISSTKYNII